MIYTIGETVIDLIFKNMQPQAAKVGGSALNTSVSLGRLGNRVSFVSEIGCDELGHWCKSFLSDNGVEVTNLVQYSDKKTSLALAFLNEKNDATYRFYKEFSEPMPVQNILFNADDIVLFSSSFSLNSRVRNAVVHVLQQAKERHTLIMYDPNMRRVLQKDTDEYRYLYENLRCADVVHLSDEDAQAMFGTTDVNAVFLELQHYGVKVLVFTQNKDEVIVFTNADKLSYSVPSITTVSTIGAGDTFNAGILHNLNKQHITKDRVDNLSKEFWNTAIPFAIACAGNVCQSIDNYIDKDFTNRLYSEL